MVSLRSRLPERRETLTAARALVVEAERADRIQMSEAIARGDEAESDVESVQRARSQAAAAERALQAHEIAIEAAENEVHQAALAGRADWRKSAERAATVARGRARKALDELERQLLAVRQAQRTIAWLADDSGLDRQQRARPATLGPAPGSASVTANEQAVDLGLAFSWLQAAIGEPEVPSEQRHSRDQWPTVGPLASASG